MNRRRKSLVLVSLGIISGVAAWSLAARNTIPDDPDELILYSLDPTQVMREYGEMVLPKDKEVLYDCPVFGKVVVADPEQRRAILAAVKEDIRTGFKNQAKCHYPRHMLRVVKGGKSLDIVICFECHGYQVFRGGDTKYVIPKNIGEGSKAVLNRILTDAGVPIAPPAF